MFNLVVVVIREFAVSEVLSATCSWFVLVALHVRGLRILTMKLSVWLWLVSSSRLSTILWHSMMCEVRAEEIVLLR